MKEELTRTVPDAMKGVVSLLVDGGPDFSPKHLINLLAYGRLWKDSNLDCLMVTTHAAGYSAYKIEHAWSLLSRALAGVTLPNSLPGELPPEQKQGLSEDELTAELATVLDAAINILGGYWNGLKFDGFGVDIRAVPCQDAG